MMKVYPNNFGLSLILKNNKLECAQRRGNCPAGLFVNMLIRMPHAVAMGTVMLGGGTIPEYSQDCHPGQQGLCLQSHLENPAEEEEEDHHQSQNIPKLIFTVFYNEEFCNGKCMSWV